VLARPLAHLAAKAEMRTLRAHYEDSDIADGCLVDRLAQRDGKSAVQPVEWRIGENDVADRPVTLETNAAHTAAPVQCQSDAARLAAESGMIGSKRCEGRSASR